MKFKIDILKLLFVRSKKLYAPILSYFDHINIKEKDDWFLQSNTISNSEKQIVTKVLLNQEYLLSEFTFFLGMMKKLESYTLPHHLEY